jgi:glutaredoxin
MKTRLFCCTLLLTLASASAGAQMYKWVAANGTINYSDTPPPADARKSERKTINANSLNSQANLPYELEQLVKTQPVTLYTMPNCAPCDEGRALLQARGIPFTEKTVNSADDIAQLQKAGGSSSLPFLQIGSVKQQGIDAGVWQQLLGNAGYPAASRLPKTYQPAPAQAAAPAKPAPATGMAYREGPPVRGKAEPDAPPNNTATPGFRF